MTEYIHFILTVLITALVIGVVGLIAAGGYMLYKTIKEDF